MSREAPPWRFWYAVLKRWPTPKCATACCHDWRKAEQLMPHMHTGSSGPARATARLRRCRQCHASVCPKSGWRTSSSGMLSSKPSVL
eukprot:5216281-Lingulodinium_polyedra.AAC.1